ncbi:MAG: PH domain-containing protein [Patescibacteria group bacterium]|jgi:hypothetical protein
MAAVFSPIPEIKEHAKAEFPGQFPDEKVIFLVRRHWSVIFKFVCRLIIAHFVPIAVFLILYYLLEWEIPTEGPMYVAMVMVVSTYYLGIWLLYIHEYVDYHLDIWVLTNKRVVSIEQEGLFKRTTAELTLNKIQDVSSEIRGKVQTFLNFGNVYVKTASDNQRFVFEEVAKPQEVARIVANAVEKNAETKIPPK